MITKKLWPAIFFLSVSALCGVAVGRSQQQLDADPWQPSAALLEKAKKLTSPRHLQEFLAINGDDLLDISGDCVDVLRAGLRLPEGPAAITCAGALDASFLDDWEARRVVDLLMPIAIGSHPSVDFDDRFRFILGSVDVPSVFEALNNHKGTERVYLGKIHKIMRSKDVDLALGTSQFSNSMALRFALDLFYSATGYDNLKRQSIAKAICRLLGLEISHRETAGGFNPALSTLLRSIFIQPNLQHQKRLGDLVDTLPGWLLRWMSDSKPAVVNRQLLLDLANRFEADGMRSEHAIVLLKFGGFTNEADVKMLSRLAMSNPFATTALLLRGVSGSRDSLERLALTDPAALALLAEYAPDRFLQIVSEALIADVRISQRQVAIFGKAMNDISRRFSIHWSHQTLSKVRHVLELNARINPVGALALGVTIPYCQSRTLARIALSKMNSATTDNERIRFEEELGEKTGGLSRKTVRKIIAFLNEVEPLRFRKWLRACSKSKSNYLASYYTGILFQLGDTAAGGLLLEYAKRLLDHSGTPQLPLRNAIPYDYEILSLLAKSRNSQVDAFLSRQSIFGAATLLGLSPSVSEFLEGNTPEDLQETVEKALTDRDANKALSLVLDTIDLREKLTYVNVDFSKDAHECVLKWLRKVQGRRELGMWAWATGQLSLCGCEKARRSVWNIIKDGRNFWLDEWPESVLTNGYDGKAMGFWIPELRSQCCRILTDSSCLFSRLEDSWSWSAPASAGAFTAHDWALQRWSEIDSFELVWSEYLSGFQLVQR